MLRSLKELGSWVRTNRVRRTATLVLIDFIILSIAYIAALFARFLGTPYFQFDVLMFVSFAGLVTVFSLYTMGVYRRIWSRSSGHEISIVLNACLISFAVIVIVSLLLRTRAVPLSVVLVAQALGFAGFVAVRFRSRLVSGVTWRWNRIWQDSYPRVETRVLIIGAGESGQALAWRLKYRSQSTNYRIVGFVDDDKQKQGLFVEGAEVLGQRDDIPRLVKQHNIELVVLAIHNVQGESFREILRLCEQTSARIKVVPNLFAQMDATKGVEFLRDVQAEDLLGRTPITRHEAVDLTAVTGKTVVVTGAAGSIGSELARQLAMYQPVCVLLLDNNESGLHDLNLDLTVRFPDTEYLPILVDVTHRSAVERVFEQYRPQVVFHAAAYKHVPMLQSFPGAAIHSNIVGTRVMAELSRDFHCERFVLISSDKAVRPGNVMGATKRVCELLIHALAAESSDTRFTAVRFGNVLGSRGSVVPIFNRQIDLGGPVTVTHAEMKRYFMSIPEAVNLVIHAACLTQGDDIFLLKMGEVIRIVDLAERMIRLRGLRPYHDIDIVFTHIRPGEKLGEELYGDNESPSDTVHPHIVLLNSWAYEFDHPQFWQLLEQVTAIDYFEYEPAMLALNNLMNVKSPTALVVK